MPKRLRTLGIVAHIDAGKTTLTERILFDAGARRFVGEVDEGTAAMDWMRQEQERGISIVAAATHVAWNGCELQIVDTPGHVDFLCEVERCMRVLDSVLVVLDGVRGVESQTETVWRQADAWGCARLVFVNKMDRVGADYEAARAAVAERFSVQAVPFTTPLYGEDGAFCGIGEPVHGSVLWFEGEVPPDQESRLGAQLHAAREQLIEACAEFDEGILDAYVSGGTVAPERLLAALRHGCIHRLLVPVLCGSALRGLGVDLLLDAACSLLPSPADRDRSGFEEAFPLADPAAPVRALVFKVEHADGEVRNYARVFSGVLRSGEVLTNERTGEGLFVPALWSMRASSHDVVEAATAGSIVVLPDLVGIRTGDTLLGARAKGRLYMPPFSPPVLAAVFEPEEAAAQARIEEALAELQWDDPSLQVATDPETSLPLVAGMGELHLEIVAERVRERTRAPMHLGKPRVAQRATVAGVGAGAATVVAPHDAERTASARLVVEPAEGGLGAVVEVQQQAQVPEAAAVADWLREVGASGGELGAPWVGIRIAVEELAPCAADREGALLQTAVAIALHKALVAAGAVLLEPVVEFSVRCPDESKSVVLADLQARGAILRLVSSGQLGALLLGKGRMRAFLGYATRLRSLTKGKGEAQLAPAGFAPLAEGLEGPLVPQI